MKFKIAASWQKKLQEYLDTDSFSNLADFVKSEYETKTIYPEFNNIFNAFQLTSFSDVRVVILGQDPYHGPNQAQGLSFSVPGNIRNPPSLKNIFKEIEAEYGYKCEAESKHEGNLECWATQGVLLLNAVLTVEAGRAGSHAKKGWEDFTDSVLKEISNQKENVVFVLWGNYARKKKSLLDESKHKVLESVHPSPFSARHGFFGSNHFLQVNKSLDSWGIKKILW